MSPRGRFATPTPRDHSKSTTKRGRGGLVVVYNHTIAVTTPSPSPATNGTTEFIYDYSEIDTEIYTFGVCNTSVFEPGHKRIVQLAFWFSAGWIAFWVLLITVVNLAYRQFGAHRFLEMWQEVGFLAIYVVMGVLVLMPEHEYLCIATTLALQFLLVFLMGCAFMIAFFASSLIKGSSIRNGRLPLAVNFLWPVVMGSLSAVANYYSLRETFNSTGVHCFAPIHSPLFFVFAIQAWILWFSTLIRNQLSITACRQTRPTVDREQLYWARKSVKGAPIMLSWFLMTFFTLLFAVDMQVFWLAILYASLACLFGPLLFLLHTSNHQATNNGLHAALKLPVYRVCAPRRAPIVASDGDGQPPPAPPPPLVETLRAPPLEPIRVRQGNPHLGGAFSPPSPSSTAPLPSSALAERKREEPHLPPAPTVLPTPIVLPPPPAPPPVNTEPTSAQVFYDWLVDRNEHNIELNEKILFRPRPV